jgi:Lon-like ATP-dependent protease
MATQKKGKEKDKEKDKKEMGMKEKAKIVKEAISKLAKKSPEKPKLTGSAKLRLAGLQAKLVGSAKEKFEKLKDTSEIPVSKEIVNQVIGQEPGVEVIKKAASQRRHVFLIGEPGTGKSMLGLALAELLPKEKLVDIIAFPNPNDENQPLIRTVPAGEGRDLIAKAKIESMGMFKNQNIFMFLLAILAMIAPWWVRSYYKSDIMFAAFFIGGMMFLAAFVIFINLGKRGISGKETSVPKTVVDNFKKDQAPFLDATGAHAGALLGDVLHDPFQSGGLGTPAHERVVAGMIHKANKGVLFIDEMATLQPHTQQELLSALQEKKYAITGQSERSAGAMVRTEAVPCDFVLVAAGNLETIKHMHPALRSRITGYGYEIYMNETIKDTPENRWKIAVFVAQEVAKDGKIPHFSKSAVERIVEEARRRANRKNHLTLRLRDLGGLVRAAGDIAKEKGAALVTKEHVLEAKKIARSLEQQIADKFIERKKEYEVIITEGKIVGRVNGLAVIGGEASYSGIILPIESQVTPGGKEKEFVATGKLGEIAKEAVKNVSAIIKKYFGEDIQKYDVYVQFLQTYEGVEGDSASIAVATSIISALKNIPVKQNTAMTGSLSVRGEVLPVGGVTAKVEAAIEAGIKRILVPKSNLQDIIIDEDKVKKIEIVPVETISEVLKEALDWKGKAEVLKTIEDANGK